MSVCTLFLQAIINIAMNLAEKSQSVVELFNELEEEARKYQKEGGLGCISGCGFCCANPNVPASALEFLPLAFELYANGIAEEVANQLALQEKPGNCILYKTQSEDGKMGYCSSYKNRGLICRLFGSSARKNNKTGKKELIVCKILKEQKNEIYQQVTEGINSDLDVPMASAYYTRMNDIDENLTQQYPVNQAILTALEVVLRYKFYEEEGGTIQL